MVFSSMIFLCVFFPVVFLLYQIAPGIRAKNILLIVVSLLFYAYGEPVYVFLMIGSTVFNYWFGVLLDRQKDVRRKKAVLAVSVVVNVALLVLFKYLDMIISTWNLITGMNLELFHIALPVGISFFTFQAMSYVIDVYRGETEAQKSYLKVLLYISFFPQLIAGPIVKYHDIELQITDRSVSARDMAEGGRRFVIGLAKKVLISNTVAAVADAIFGASSGDWNIISAWIGAISYMLQIYYDFSGYSDMAIGMGRMFGFHFQENFLYPYSSKTIKEFWRRWHISLSTWFREYIYIPLGGNRKGKARTEINKMIVFLTTGLWHGANWTFVVWGIFHGAFLLLEDYVSIKRLPAVIQRIYTLLVVCVGFVIFRADSISQAGRMIGKMFTGFSFEHAGMALLWNQLTPLYLFTLVCGLIGMFPVAPYFVERLKDGKRAAAFRAVSYGASLVLLVLSMCSLASGTYNPFIYFRF